MTKQNHHFDKIKNDLELKEAENYLLQSELTDTLQPSVNISEGTLICIQMLSENNLYIQKNGTTEKAVQSRDRLLKLFNCLTELDSITTTNHNLKLTNNFMHAQNNTLRIKVYDLQKELDNIKKAFDGI